MKNGVEILVEFFSTAHIHILFVNNTNKCFVLSFAQCVLANTHTVHKMIDNSVLKTANLVRRCYTIRQSAGRWLLKQSM